MCAGDSATSSRSTHRFRNQRRSDTAVTSNGSDAAGIDPSIGHVSHQKAVRTRKSSSSIESSANAAMAIVPRATRTYFGAARQSGAYVYASNTMNATIAIVE